MGVAIPNVRVSHIMSEISAPLFRRGAPVLPIG